MHLCEEVLHMAETDRSSPDADDLAGLLPEHSLLSLEQSLGHAASYRERNPLPDSPFSH